MVFKSFHFPQSKLQVQRVSPKQLTYRCCTLSQNGVKTIWVALLFLVLNQINYETTTSVADFSALYSKHLDLNTIVHTALAGARTKPSH